MQASMPPHARMDLLKFCEKALITENIFAQP
jgi:hypothetical protein